MVLGGQWLEGLPILERRKTQPTKRWPGTGILEYWYYWHPLSVSQVGTRYNVQSDGVSVCGPLNVFGRTSSSNSFDIVKQLQYKPAESLNEV